MPVWRCPHCATPQAESARCWVCRRSTTCCATCLHFRRGVANGLGTCGLDRRRTALRGTEMRACWAAPAPEPEPSRAAAIAASASRSGDAERPRPRTFVPVDELRAPSRRPAVDPPPAIPPGPVAPAWSLWGDLDP